MSSRKQHVPDVIGNKDYRARKEQHSRQLSESLRVRINGPHHGSVAILHFPCPAETSHDLTDVLLALLD